MISPKDVMKYDEEAPQHRKDRPAPDEEAYAPDKEAAQHRNIEPALNEDEPLHRNNGPIADKNAPRPRNIGLIPGEYKIERQKNPQPTGN